MKTITVTEIKEKLVHHHDPDDLPDDRELTTVNVMFYVLPGSPPDGYAIFIKARKLLILYTTRGDPFERIEVDEIVSSAEKS